MNTVITYSVVNSKRTTNCGSLLQALALVHKLGLSTDAIQVHTDEPPYVNFFSMDELIGDIVRNHAQLYRLIKWGDNGSGMRETIVYAEASSDEVIHWLIGHMESYELMGYRFDTTSHTGSYHCCNELAAGSVGGIRIEEIKE